MYNEQISFYKRPPEKSCYTCQCFSELKKPRPVEDGTATIFGYCFKDRSNMGKGYPVYIPKGSCRDHTKKSR